MILEQRRVDNPEDSPRKEPWLAAALNLIPVPLALGYVYVDRPVRFAVSTVFRCAAAAVTWTYLWPVIESCTSDSCIAGAVDWLLILVPPLVVVGLSVADARSVALAHNRTGYAIEEGPPRRRAGSGALTVMGLLGLISLGALRIGDVTSTFLIVLVISSWWLMWRTGRTRLPDDYRPPDEPEGGARP